MKASGATVLTTAAPDPGPMDRTKADFSQPLPPSFRKATLSQGMDTHMNSTNPARVFLETGAAWLGVMASKIEHFGPSDLAASVTVIYTVMQIIRMVTGWRAKKVAP